MKWLLLIACLYTNAELYGYAGKHISKQFFQAQQQTQDIALLDLIDSDSIAYKTIDTQKSNTITCILSQATKITTCNIYPIAQDNKFITIAITLDANKPTNNIFATICDISQQEIKLSATLTTKQGIMYFIKLPITLLPEKITQQTIQNTHILWQQENDILYIAQLAQYIDQVGNLITHTIDPYFREYIAWRGKHIQANDIELEIAGTIHSFMLKSVLGIGRFGIVFKGISLTYDKPVAIKFFDYLILKDKAQKYANKELLSYKKIAKIPELQVFTTKTLVPLQTLTWKKGSITLQYPYFAMQYIEGETLDYLWSTRKLTFETLKAIIQQIFDICMICLTNNFSISDMHQNNTMIGTNNKVTIIDCNINEDNLNMSVRLLDLSPWYRRKGDGSRSLKVFKSSKEVYELNDMVKQYYTDYLNTLEKYSQNFGKSVQNKIHLISVTAQEIDQEYRNADYSHD